MSVLRALFLALALWGAFYPMIITQTWLTSEGASPILFLEPVFNGGVISEAGWNIMFVAIVINIWILAEVYVRKNWIALVALPALWGIGLGCGLPLYLFLRTAAPR